ncbi:hypothetical protein T492DRAFT_181880 [Pavlovales sp. CCMP2436]|nr:hypothetical protein T492DRAFT_181880 [Pavlovales sp. CCMP2436]
MEHFRAHHLHRTPEMHVPVAPLRPLPSSLAPTPRPASPPVPMVAREMPLPASAKPGLSVARAEEERECAEALLNALLTDLVRYWLCGPSIFCSVFLVCVCVCVLSIECADVLLNALLTNLVRFFGGGGLVSLLTLYFLCLSVFLVCVCVCGGGVSI